MRQAVCDGLPCLDDAQLEILVVGGQGLQLCANYTPEIVPKVVAKRLRKL
jgi:hypothetical protein